MSKSITSFVGLDVHKDCTAIAEAQQPGGEAPRFIGTVGPELSQLLKALKSLGKPEAMLVVYEAGPCGYGLARELRSRGCTRTRSASPLLENSPAFSGTSLAK